MLMHLKAYIQLFMYINEYMRVFMNFSKKIWQLPVLIFTNNGRLMPSIKHMTHFKRVCHNQNDELECLQCIYMYVCVHLYLIHAKLAAIIIN